MSRAAREGDFRRRGAGEREGEMAGAAGAEAPGWGGLRLAVLAAAGRCEAVVAGLRDAPRGDVRPVRAALQAAAELQDLAAQVTRMAWDEAVAEQAVTRAASRAFREGYAAGARAAARRRAPVPGRDGPRPLWPRAARE